MADLRTAAQQALETLEALQGCCTDHDDGTVEAITVWCPEVIDALRSALALIQPEIKADKEARWLPMPWKGLTEEEHNYYKALGFVGVKAVEEKLRAKNSTLVSK
jgi:hypothetical protein